MTKLEEAIAQSKALGPLALYHGCWNGPGHYLHDTTGKTLWDKDRHELKLSWDFSLMDGGLLDNGSRPDVYDGKVYHTCSGLVFWHAFYWWDRSGDHRRASNSGFYVRGFSNLETSTAFDFACESFPHIVKRQKQPLILQGVELQ